MPSGAASLHGHWIEPSSSRREKETPAKDGVCDKCGGSNFKRRADDNEEPLKTRLMAYYKETSPLIGYYYAKGLLQAVDGMASMDAVGTAIAGAMDKAR